MNIKIVTHAAAENFLSHNRNLWHSVVCLNTNEHIIENIAADSKSYISLHFDDIVYPLTDLTVPTEKDIALAIAFAKDKPQVIFCDFGAAGRSPALAYVCLCAIVSPDEAIKSLTPVRHYPNPAIIKLGTKILQNDNILSVYEKWINSYRIKLPKWQEAKKELFLEP